VPGSLYKVYNGVKSCPAFHLTRGPEWDFQVKKELVCGSPDGRVQSDPPVKIGRVPKSRVRRHSTGAKCGAIGAQTCSRTECLSETASDAAREDPDSRRPASLSYPYSLVGARVYVMNRFEEIYRKHLNAVFRYALSCVGRREIAEEITSQAFLELFRHRDEVDANRLPGWLLTVTKNRAVDHWRRQSVEQRYRESLAREESANQSNDDFGLFDNEALKPAHRVCLILRYVHGMDDRSEIAQRIGLTPDQVKSRLQYARQLLREQLNHSCRGVK